MTTDKLEQTLLAGAAEMGIALTPPDAQRLLRLIAEVAEWNQRINLTAITEPQEMVQKHLLDSLSLQPWLHGQRIADVGTGAGFPGLPLALVNPGRSFTLIEATGKKARFVEHACRVLELGNVQVVNDRAESWRPSRPFDSVVARALGKLPDFVRVAGHLCGRGGQLLAMKGQLPQAEIDALPAGWRVAATYPLRVPGLQAERHLLVLQRH